MSGKVTNHIEISSSILISYGFNFFVKVEKHIQISDKKMLKMDSAKRFEHWFARIQVYRTREINTDIYRKTDDIADKGACSVFQLPGRNPDLV